MCLVTSTLHASCLQILGPSGCERYRQPAASCSERPRAADGSPVGRSRRYLFEMNLFSHIGNRPYSIDEVRLYAPWCAVRAPSPF